jgi:hypothetical protein
MLIAFEDLHLPTFAFVYLSLLSVNPGGKIGNVGAEGRAAQAACAEGGGGVRWDDLFADLEAQLEAAQGAELSAEVADRTRHEAAQLWLIDRLVPAAGHDVRLQVRGAGQVSGRLDSLGAEWLLVSESAGRQALVPVAAVLSAGGLGALSRAPGQESRVFARLGLGSALRAIARDRVQVVVGLVDGGAVTGTVDRVGADFVEVAEHGPGEPRRQREVSGMRAVAFAAIAVVRSG